MSRSPSPSSSVQTPSSLLLSLRGLTRAPSTPAARTSIASQLEALSHLASTPGRGGLSTRELRSLLTLALEARPAVARKLLRCAIPARGARLRARDVELVLGCLGGARPIGDGIDGDEERGDVDVGVQAALLRLLLCFLEPPAGMPSDVDGASIALPTSFLTPKARQTLGRGYGILFHFLDYATLRPHLCALLAALTRRAHVKPYRVARLMALRATNPTDGSLTSLLASYATFLPSLLFALPLPSISASVKHVDPSWLASARATHTTGGATAEAPPPGKRPRLSLAASVNQSGTLVPLPICTPIGTRPLATEARSSIALGSMLPRLLLPANLAASLAHPPSRLAIAASGDGAHGARIARWVLARLQEDWEAGKEARCRDLAELAARSWRTTGLPPQATQWVMERVQWEALAALVPLLPPTEWEDFNAAVVQPLTECANKTKLQQRQAAPEEVLNALASMLARWGRVDWTKLQRDAAKGRLVYYDATPLQRNVDYTQTLRNTAHAAAELAMSLIVSHPTLRVQAAALRVLEVLSSPSLTGAHTFLLPSPAHLLLLLLSRGGGIMPLSRACGLVQAVRAKFNAHESAADALANVNETTRQYFSEANKDRLNEAVVLLADLVWRVKALDTVEAGNTDVGMKPYLVKRLRARCDEAGCDLAQIASVTHGSAFIALAEAYANESAQAAKLPAPVVRGPVTAGALRDARKAGLPAVSLVDFRAAFLGWLEERGAIGVTGLLRATMSSLSKALPPAAAA